MSSQHRVARPLAVALLLAGAGGAVAQGDPAALEARIAAIEAQLSELKAELAAQRGAPVATAPAPAPAPAKPGAPPPPPPIQGTTILPGAVPNTRFTAGGFIKFDSIYSRTDGGEMADGSAGRLFYLPSAIPVGGAEEGTDLDMHAQFSRLWFAADSTTDAGDTLRAYIEMDIFGNANGNETATNTYGLTIRHAYLSFNQWLAGQTWSNFQDVAALPDAVDFIGPTEGTVFVRQAQLRYTSGPWVFSLENPETTFTPFRGGATRNVSDDNNIPDATLRWTKKGDWGHFSLGGILRQLRYETTGTGADSDSETGFGVTLSGKYVLSPTDDLRYTVIAGQGIGRYVGLALDTDAVVEANGDLDASDAVAGFLGWRHVFSPKWRGNLFGSWASFDHDPLVSGAGATSRSHSLHANLIYTPLPKVDVGAELIFANREIESGADGDLDRLHVHVKYSF